MGVADTIGTGTPLKAMRAIAATHQHHGVDDISNRFHDAYGQALASVLAALQMGIWQFGTVLAGLGSCPYGKGGTENVATEDLVYLLHGMGIETGVDLGRLVDAGIVISSALGRKRNSGVSAAVLGRRG